MERVAIFLLIYGLFFTNVLFAAQLVDNEITLCTNGYSPNNTTCETYDSGNCDSGYHEIASSSLLSPSNCNYGGYKKYTVLDNVIIITYNGAILGEEVTLCNNGYSTNNASCTQYTNGSCDSGYHEIGASSLLPPSNCNYGGYKKYTVLDNMINVTYNGVVIGDEVTLCNNGYSTNNTSCTAYAQGACPNSYHDIKAPEASFTAYNGTCGTGYSRYVAQEPCGYMPSKSSCIGFCNDGSMTTGAGTCATLCDLGATKLRTSNGIVVPLWSTKQTYPALNIGFNDGVCYGNLTDEATNEMSIWFQWGNTRLHTTK